MIPLLFLAFLVVVVSIVARSFARIGHADRDRERQSREARR